MTFFFLFPYLLFLFFSKNLSRTSELVLSPINPRAVLGSMQGSCVVYIYIYIYAVGIFFLYIYFHFYLYAYIFFVFCRRYVRLFFRKKNSIVVNARPRGLYKIRRKYVCIYI